MKEPKHMTNEELLNAYNTYYDIVNDNRAGVGMKETIILFEIEHEMIKREE